MKDLNNKELFAVAGGMKQRKGTGANKDKAVKEVVKIVTKDVRIGCCAKLGLMAVGAIVGGVPVGIAVGGIAVYYYGDDAVKAINTAGDYLSGQASSAYATVSGYFAKEEANA